MKIACIRLVCRHVCAANTKPEAAPQPQLEPNRTDRNEINDYCSTRKKYTLNRFEPWNRRIVVEMSTWWQRCNAVNGRNIYFLWCPDLHGITHKTLIHICILIGDFPLFQTKTKYENVYIQGWGTSAFLVNIRMKINSTQWARQWWADACRCSITLRAMSRVKIYNFLFFFACPSITRNCYGKKGRCECVSEISSIKCVRGASIKPCFLYSQSSRHIVS